MLFHVLGLPEPNSDTRLANCTVLVWGGASNVSKLAIQLARLAGLNVYAVASKQHHEYLRSLGAKSLFDYHSTAVVEDVVATAEREVKPVAYVADAISLSTTLGPVQEILAKSTARVKRIAHSAPWPEELAKADGIDAAMVHGDEVWFKPALVELGAQIFHEYLPEWLETGSIVPSPYRVVDGGLGQIQAALNELEAGVSNQKLLVETWRDLILAREDIGSLS